jgi:hypothetical protein
LPCSSIGWRTIPAIGVVAFALFAAGAAPQPAAATPARPVLAAGPVSGPLELANFRGGCFRCGGFAGGFRSRRFFFHRPFFAQRRFFFGRFHRFDFDRRFDRDDIIRFRGPGFRFGFP